MKFTIERECLLKPLQRVNSLLSNRQTLPILKNLLLQVKQNMLFLTSTDLEVEITARITLFQEHNVGETTVSIRKFLDICRWLPEGVEITVQLKNDRIQIQSGKSYFSLLTLPADNFPNFGGWKNKLELTSLSQRTVRHMIEATQFSMAYQDARYYLNGILFETDGNELRTVATDGYRLALCSMNTDVVFPKCSVIIPRKGIIELMRMLGNNNFSFQIQINNNNIRAYIGDFIFTSKLIDGCFPNYRRVLPKNPDKILEVNCNALKQALIRVAVLSSQKFRGVRLHIKNNQLKVTANNSEQEEAEEILDIVYSDIEIEICFNVTYILDVLNVLKCKNIRILLTDSVSSVQISDSSNQNAIYVIMPMRL